MSLLSSSEIGLLSFPDPNQTSPVFEVATALVSTVWGVRIQLIHHPYLFAFSVKMVCIFLKNVRIQNISSDLLFLLASVMTSSSINGGVFPFSPVWLNNLLAVKQSWTRMTMWHRIKMTSSAAAVWLWQTSKAEVMLQCQALAIKELRLLFRFKILH